MIRNYVLERMDVVKKEINNNHNDVQWNKLRPLPLPCCMAAGFSPVKYTRKKIIN